MIPTSDICESRFNTSIGFDEPRDLLEGITESTLILSAVGWSVWVPIDRLDHLHRFERFLARSHQPRIGRRRVHGFQNGRHFFISGVELLQVVDCYGLMVAAKRPRQLGTDGNRAKGRRARIERKGTIEPTVLARFAGRSRFHEVLSIKMRARWIGGACGVNDRQLTTVPEWLQGL